MRVLVGCPISSRYSYCIDSYLSALGSQTFKDFDLLLVDNSKDLSFYSLLKKKGVPVRHIEYCEPSQERLVRSRNMLLDQAIDGNYDYLLSLESDIMIQPDTLSRLLAHGKNVVSAYYGSLTTLFVEDNITKERKKVVLDFPILFFDKGDNMIQRANPSDILGKGIVRIGACGLGCALISREVFTRIRFRWANEGICFDDMFFCDDVVKLGFEIFADGDLVVKHLHAQWKDYR